jgi:hypothetical protein
MGMHSAMAYLRSDSGPEFASRAIYDHANPGIPHECGACSPSHARQAHFPEPALRYYDETRPRSWLWCDTPGEIASRCVL